MAKSVRLIDIAQPLGVSTVTVSKALSGQKGVSEEMREKIVRLANELGYKQPSAWNREREQQSTEKKSANIGVLIHEKYFDKYDSFYLQMYRQVAMIGASENNFTLMEVVTCEMERGLAVPKLIQEQKADGILVIGKLSDAYLDFLSNTVQQPQVYLDFYDEAQKVDAVVSDSFYGAYVLTNYLFDMGHEKIGYVGTLCATSSITDRYLGYVKSLLEHGVQVRPDWQLDDREKETGIMDEAQFLQLPEEMPTAFVCNCDKVASMLIRKLEGAGFRVPEDISVVGYDNYLYPGLCDVEITTFEVDIHEMALQAMHILEEKLQNKSSRPGRTIVEGHIVLKNSVRKLEHEQGKH